MSKPSKRKRKPQNGGTLDNAGTLPVLNEMASSIKNIEVYTKGTSDIAVEIKSDVEEIKHNTKKSWFDKLKENIALIAAILSILGLSIFGVFKYVPSEEKTDDKASSPPIYSPAVVSTQPSEGAAESIASNEPSAEPSASVESSVEPTVTIPTVVTKPATNISLESADINGQVTANDSYPISDYGFYWGTSDNPSVKVSLGNSTVSPIDVSYTLTGLNNSTTYFCKLYAKSAQGEVVFGDVITFITIAATLPTSNPSPAPSPTIEQTSPPSTEPVIYEFYPSADFSTVKRYANNTLYVETEFTATKIEVIALSLAGEESKVTLLQTSRNKWSKKVYFEEIGVFTLTFYVTADDGTVITKTMDIEVIPEISQSEIDDIINNIIPGFTS